MKIDGACHCGFISFEADVDPERISICHCTDCQTLSGSPYRASVVAAREAFRLLTGTPSTYVKTAESGARRIQTFCPTCGSPIYATAEEDETAPVVIRLGAIRQRDELRPRRQLWGRSRQHWADDLGAIPRFEKQSA